MLTNVSSPLCREMDLKFFLTLANVHPHHQIDDADIEYRIRKNRIKMKKGRESTANFFYQLFRQFFLRKRTNTLTHFGPENLASSGVRKMDPKQHQQHLRKHK